MATTTGDEALAEQAGAAFAEGDCTKALELLGQLQKQREDGVLSPLTPPRRAAPCILASPSACIANPAHGLPSVPTPSHLQPHGAGHLCMSSSEPPHARPGPAPAVAWCCTET